MIGATLALARQLPHAGSHKRGPFKGHVRRCRGQAVGDVVDQDLKLEPINSFDFVHAAPKGQSTITTQYRRMEELDPRPLWVSFASFLARSTGVCLSPNSGGIADIRQPPLGAMCGRLRVGKKNLHFAAMVGAAMCSAC